MQKHSAIQSLIFEFLIYEAILREVKLSFSANLSAICASGLLWLIFTFIFWCQPLVAIVIMTGANEKDRCCSIKSDNVRVGRRMGGGVKHFHPGAHCSFPVWNLKRFNLRKVREWPWVLKWTAELTNLQHTTDLFLNPTKWYCCLPLTKQPNKDLFTKLTTWLLLLPWCGTPVTGILPGSHILFWRRFTQYVFFWES